MMDETNQTICFTGPSASGAVVGPRTTTSFAQPSFNHSSQGRSRRRSDQKIERAVYSHIRAVRTLGRTKD